MTERSITFVSLIPIVLVVIAMMLISGAGLVGTVTINTSLTMDDYGSLLANLLLIALLVERFIEVFVGILRRHGKVEKRRAIDTAARRSDKAEAETAMAIYKSRTNTIAMNVAFGFGLVVSLAGVHTLGVIFDAGELRGTQQFLFQVTDILLTAGLIAGGSNGINKVTGVFGEYLQKSKMAAEDKGPEPKTK
jgi:hypothetical protein